MDTSHLLPAQPGHQTHISESASQDFVLFDLPVHSNQSAQSPSSLHHSVSRESPPNQHHNKLAHSGSPVVLAHQPESPSRQSQISPHLSVPPLVNPYKQEEDQVYLNIHPPVVSCPSNRLFACSAPASTNLHSIPSSVCSQTPPFPPASSRPVKMMNAADVELEAFIHSERGSMSYTSQAVPNCFEVDGSSSSSVSNLATISPQDLFAQDPLISEPNSSAITTLTTPSSGESPDLDPYYISPSHAHLEPNDAGDTWFPLFPKDSSVPEAASSVNSTTLNPDVLKPAVPTSRRRSRASSDASLHPHSSIAGVGSRKRDKPLPPIVVDDVNDVVAVKRARNTLAARKSRQRKAQQLQDSEARNAELEAKCNLLMAERDYWKGKAQKSLV